MADRNPRHGASASKQHQLESSHSSSDELYGFGRRLRKAPLQESLVHGATSAPTLEDKEFYLTPYLTCRNCNALNFINSTILMASMAIINGRHQLNKQEGLPPCVNCKKVAYLQLGAVSYAEEIEEETKQHQKLLLRQQTCAVILQCAFRCYRARQLLQQLRHSRAVRDKQHRECTTKIQCAYRRYMANRRTRTLRCLQLIQAADPTVVLYAVENYPKRKHVFWYYRKAETDLLFKDYQLLVARTGNKPPLYVVEENVREVAVRVCIRTDELASKIQAHWRGVLARKFTVIVKEEVIRLRELHNATAWRIQRVVRGYYGRKQAKEPRIQRYRVALLRQYKAERELQGLKDHQHVMNEKLKANYVAELQQAQVGRLVGLVPCGQKRESPLKSLQQSSVISGKSTRFVKEYLRDREKNRLIAEARRQEEKDRLKFVTAKQKENTYLHHYFEAEREAHQQREAELNLRKVTRMEASKAAKGPVENGNTS